MKATPAEEAEGIEALIDFLMGTRTLEDWAALQARALFESVPSWQKMHYIPRDQWEKKFHLSKVKATTRSVQCIKDYLRVTEFDELL